LKVYLSWDLDSSTASTAGPSGSIVRDRCHVLYSSDSETVTSEHSDRGLRSRTRSPSAMSTRRSYSDVKRGNSLVFRGLGCCGCCLHCGVWCSLESVGFHVLSSCASGYCLGACEVCYVDHGVVEGGVDVGYSPSVRRCLRLLRHAELPDKSGLEPHANLNSPWRRRVQLETRFLAPRPQP
jgi:hypothetical protein